MDQPIEYDFFISYSSHDQAWAEWIAWQLEADGYRVKLQAWDFRPGSDFIHQMDQAIQHARRLIAVLSPAYLQSKFGEAEWRPFFAEDPTGEEGLLVLVRVANVAPPSLLKSRVYIDLSTQEDPRVGEGRAAGRRPSRAHQAAAGANVPAALVVRNPPTAPNPGAALSQRCSDNLEFIAPQPTLHRSRKST